MWSNTHLAKNLVVRDRLIGQHPYWDFSGVSMKQQRVGDHPIPQTLSLARFWDQLLATKCLQCSEFYLCLMMMHLREELSQELFSEDLCDEGNIKVLALGFLASPLGGRPRLRGLNNSLIPESAIPIKSVDPHTFVINGVNFLSSISRKTKTTFSWSR